jgi:hypothetical protein
VSVDIKRRGSAAVAESSGDGANVYSRSQQAGSNVVPEVVEAYAGGAGALNEKAEGASR